MSSNNGYIFKNIPAIILVLLITHGGLAGQETILDSTFTFSAGIVKTGEALNIITRQTGYNFTYDSRLIDTERNTVLSFKDVTLKSVLDSIFKDDSLNYSVIEKFIIISKGIGHKDTRSDSIAVYDIRSITGLILDEESGDPLPYATIGLKNEGKGTVSNSNGEFGLKTTPFNLNDTIIISYLGYIGKEIPVKETLAENLTILMKREFISIPEIIIRNQIPQEVINKAMHSVPENYGTSPALLTGFYREGVLKRNKLQSYSEAIIRIFKSPYSGTLLNDQIKILKSRKIENISIKDTLTVRLKAGLSTCLHLDGAKSAFDFFLKGNMQEYNYRITDIVSFDDEAAYEIEFEPREGVELPKFKGSVFINTTDFAILHSHFEVSSEFLDKMKDAFISTSSKGYRTWPVSVRYSVSYRKVNGRYFLSHVRGDLDFLSREKRRLFNSPFEVFFEMAVTSMKTENVFRFEREELAPLHAIFSKTITSYDPYFWGDQDFLKPEENLLQALQNMKVRLQEFSE
ncbi:MAG: hypothetical protein GYA41_04305 [Bacteroidales bacterium]|nr:hypothetical protein [Bacteroidales bacterium]